MRDQVVGLFQRKGSVVDAATMLHTVGYSSSDLVGPDLAAEAGPPWTVHGEAGECMAVCHRGALIVSLAVDVPVLIWVLLASTLWKIGTLLGWMLGASIGLDRGYEPEVANHYEDSWPRAQWCWLHECVTGMHLRFALSS